MRLTLTADLHGNLPELRDECDVLVIAGDICPDFIRTFHRASHKTPQFHNGETEQLAWLEKEFIPWTGLLRAERIVVVAGNHDYVFESAEPRVRELLDSAGIDYLRDEALNIGTIKFYGLPWVPNLPRWAFHADYDKLTEVYNAVPDDTDVLVTHGPPFGYGDRTDPNLYGPSTHVGTPQCLSAIKRVKPHITVTGHIHEAYGLYSISTPKGDAPLYNVSHNTVRYEPINAPVELNYEHTIWLPGPACTRRR